MDPKLRQTIKALLKVYDGNRSEVARVLHIGRGTVAEVADSKDVQNNTEEADDQDEYHGEDNETKQEMDKMDALEKENQAMRAELADAKIENERLIKKSDKAWHQQHQNSAPSEVALAQDILCGMIADGKLDASFLEYVDVNQVSGKNRGREEYIHAVRKNMSENFLQLKYSLPTIESLICELSSVNADNETKQACASVIRRTDFVTNELKLLSTIPIDRPNLHIIPDEISARLLKDTTLLVDKVFPKLRPAIDLFKTSGKDMKFSANIASSLEDLIRIISKIDTYFTPYLLESNN